MIREQRKLDHIRYALELGDGDSAQLPDAGRFGQGGYIYPDRQP